MSSPTFGGQVATAPIDKPDSGRISVGDRTTKTITKHGKYTDLKALLPRKGEITTDGYIVSSAELTKERDAGVLIIVYEAISATDLVSIGGTSLPPDSWGLRPVITDVPIESHPAWAALTAVQRTWWKLATGELADPAVTAEKAITWIDTNGTADMKDMFAIKQRTGTFPVDYWYYTWVHHQTYVPGLSDGNVIESPYGPGAPYLGGGLTWKRSPDVLDAPGNGIYTVTREWIGAPTALGGWNTWLF